MLPSPLCSSLPLQLHLAGQVVTVVAHDPAGIDITVRIGDRPTLAELAAGSGLDVETGTLAAHVVAARDQLLAGGGFSEDRPLVRAVSVDGRRVVIDAWAGDYATSAALTRFSDPSRVIPLAAASVGVCAVVVGSDSKMVVTRRSDKVGSWPKAWWVSIGDAVSSADLELVPAASTTPTGAVVRSLAEELGIDVKPERVVVHSAAICGDMCGIAIITHVDLGPDGITATDVIEAARSAPDAWESDMLEAVDFSVAGALSVLRGRPWVPVGAVALACAASHALGPGAADEVLASFGSITMPEREVP